MNEKIFPITSAILAFIVAIGLIVLLALGQAVPTELWGAFGVVIGFFFGSNKITAKN